MPTHDPQSPRHFLVFEADIEGHPREWLRHLMRFAATSGEAYVVWFAIAREICEEFSSELSAELNGKVRLVPLKPWERRLCTHRILFINAFARWWTMRRYLRKTGAEMGHFLTLDLLSLPLALGLGAHGRRLGGILFRPSVHYRSIGPYHPTLGERLRDLRKSLLYRLMLLNRSVHGVLSLDPYFPEYAIRRYLRGNKVRAIVDPAHPPVNSTTQDARLVDLAPSDRVKFTLFGFLQERKGVLVLLDALRLLSRQSAARVAIILAGRIDPAIREAVDARIRELKAELPELWLHAEDRWLKEGELDDLVRHCDVVLAPYQRFVGSSGVLLWAARAGRPLLTQNFGLIGRLVNDHRLGLSVDSSDPAVLAGAMERMIVLGSRSFIDHHAAAAFVADRTPSQFAATVYSSLLDGHGNAANLSEKLQIS